MYYAYQYLTTDVNEIKKAIKQYKDFIIKY